MQLNMFIECAVLNQQYFAVAKSWATHVQGNSAPPNTPPTDDPTGYADREYSTGCAAIRCLAGKSTVR